MSWVPTTSFHSYGVQLAINQATEASLRKKIRKMILDDPTDEGLPANNVRMLGGLLRLAFHDCVGNKCDGCINRHNPENAGTSQQYPSVNHYSQMYIGISGLYYLQRYIYRYIRIVLFIEVYRYIRIVLFTEATQ